MKIFLAGSLGPLGKRVVKLLAAEGHEVTAPVGSKSLLEKAKSLGAKPQLLNPSNLGDMEAALYGQEAVINLVADDNNPRAWKKDPARMRAVSLNLAKASLLNKIGRFIQESTVFLYSDRNGDWVEEDAPGKHDAFATTALEIEKSIQEMKRAGATPVVLRFADFYSSDHEATRRILRWTRLGFYLDAGSPEGYLPRIHLDDAANAVSLALKAPAGVWNVSEDEPATRRQSSEALSLVLGRKLSQPSPWTASLLQAPAAPCRSLRVSNHKFKEATGWNPLYPSMTVGWKAVAGFA